MSNSFNTPILFIVFNRPDTTRRVFDEIRKIKPKQLFIAADAPRFEKIGEKELSDEVKLIFSDIDWPCEVHKLYQEKNLGCKFGPITAINWFFENVERGVILEDDCLPDLTFFLFCEELLEYYNDNEKVMHISGNNFQNSHLRGDENASYYFSNYSHNWGWATWKNSWNKFNITVNNFNEFDLRNIIEEVFENKIVQKFWIDRIKSDFENSNNWDGLWLFTVWMNNGVCILPQKNLISNIGFGGDSTHTNNVHSLLANLPTNPIEKIIHSEDLSIDKKADEYTNKFIFNIYIHQFPILVSSARWLKKMNIYRFIFPLIKVFRNN